jgi:multidrug efflux pump subunit AcrA (membrane-fusion protein)
MKLVKRLLLVLIAGALVLAGVAYYTQYRNRGTQEPDFKKARLEFDDMREVISGITFIRPEGIPVFSMISGQVVETAANNNDVVVEGQTLVKLDSRDAQIKLVRAEAALETAESAVEMAKAQLKAAELGQEAAKHYRDEAYKEGSMAGRFDKLRIDGELAKADGMVLQAKAAIPAAKARVKEAKAAVAEAKLGLELTTINVPGNNDAQKAPKQYRVLERKVELHQNIDAKQLLFTLVGDLEHMKAHAYIPEARIDRVAKGQKAVFWVDALGEDQKLSAEVAEVRMNPVQQQGAVFYEVLLNVENRKNPKTGEWQLKPGMTAPQLEITDRIHHNVWKLPVNALSFALDDSLLSPEEKKRADEIASQLDMNEWTRIWILKDDKPRAAFVRLKGLNAAGETGIRDAEFHEILDWDPQTKATLDPKNPPEVIIGVPTEKKGLFGTKFQFNL